MSARRLALVLAAAAVWIAVGIALYPDAVLAPVRALLGWVS